MADRKRRVTLTVETMWLLGDLLQNELRDDFYFDVPNSMLKLGWGQCDEEMFDYAFDILSKQKEPFFAEIMTLSNHFPFNHKFHRAA